MRGQGEGPIDDAGPGSPVRLFDDVAVAPWILMGATDSRYFAPIAENVYRFTPFRMGPADLSRIHGTGERVRVDDADRAVAFFTTLVRRACGA